MIHQSQTKDFGDFKGLKLSVHSQHDKENIIQLCDTVEFTVRKCKLALLLLVLQVDP